MSWWRDLRCIMATQIAFWAILHIAPWDDPGMLDLKRRFNEWLREHVGGL